MIINVLPSSYYQREGFDVFTKLKLKLTDVININIKKYLFLEGNFRCKGKSKDFAWAKGNYYSGGRTVWVKDKNS